MKKFLHYKGRSTWKSFWHINNDIFVSRNNIICNNDVGNTVYVHNGRFYVSFKVRSIHVGYKYGQFVMTRKFKKTMYVKKKKK